MKNRKVASPDYLLVELWKFLGPKTDKTVQHGLRKKEDAKGMEEKCTGLIFKNKGEGDVMSKYRGINLMGDTMKSSKE